MLKLRTIILALEVITAILVLVAFGRALYARRRRAGRQGWRD